MQQFCSVLDKGLMFVSSIEYRLSAIIGRVTP